MKKILTGFLAFAHLSLFAAAVNLENRPPEPECDPCHCSAPCPSGTMAITNIAMWPESPMCLGSWVYAYAETDSTSDEVVSTYWCENATTNCPTWYSTNTFWPQMTTNWWVVSHPGFSGSGPGLGVSFVPTNCGSGTITFYATYQNYDPCTGNPCGSPTTVSKSTNLVVVNVQIAETEKKICACDNTSFTLTNTCGSVTWEISPTNIPGGPTISGGTVTAGTNCGTWTVIARSTENTNCTATASVTVFTVESLAPQGGTRVGTNEPPTYVACWRATNAVDRWLRVTASSCPPVAAQGSWTNLPSCWQITGGPYEIVTNWWDEEVWTNKMTVLVDLSVVGTNTIIASAGCSKKTNVIVVQQVKLGIANTNVFVNGDDDNANGTNDVNDAVSGANSRVVGENDLVLITPSVKGTVTNETVTLSASYYWGVYGRIRVWASAERGPGEPLIDNGIWSKCETNWPANSLPTNLWVEGVSPSWYPGDVSLTLSTPFSCAVTTNLTVIDVASVRWETNRSPLLSNATLGGAGGGVAIYPDLPAATNTEDFSLVKVVVTLQPAMSNITVYLKSFDVDDPSTTNAPPLEDESVAQDNKATSNKAGKLGGASDTVTLVSGTNGVAWTNFSTTMQPGDNFRVVASPLSDFRDDCQAIQTNDHGALVFVGTTNEIPSNYRTDMLTVWRRLHVEVDKMDPVTNNFVSNNITRINGTAAAATNLFLGINLRTGLVPTDVSTNLSSPVVKLGRFQNGTIVIGTNPGATTNSVRGNGDTFVQALGTFNIPAQIVLTNATNAIGQVIALTGAVVTVTADLSTNNYSGKTLRIAGTDFTIATNTATNVTATAAVQIPFWMHDDDNDTTSPHNPDTSDLQRAFRPSYVTVLFDLANPTTNAPFVLNFADDNTGTLTAAYRFDNVGTEASTNFWTVYALGAFQLTTDSDADPNNEGGTFGIVDDFIGQGCLIFGEVMREYPVTASVSEPFTVSHEIGHLFDGRHEDLGLMQQSSTRTNTDFTPITLNRIRTIAHP